MPLVVKLCRAHLQQSLRSLNLSSHSLPTTKDRHCHQRYSDSRNYVTHSNRSCAKILNGPIQPLTPPEPPPNSNQTSSLKKPTQVINQATNLSNQDNLRRPSSENNVEPTFIPNHNHSSRQLSSSSSSEILNLEASHPTETIKLSERSLTISSQAFQISDLNISYIWLRDACQSAHSVDPSTKQKLFKTSDIPLDIHPIVAKIVYDSETTDQPELYIEWSHSLNPSSSHPQSSRFQLSFLHGLNQPKLWENKRHQQDILRPILWSSDRPVKNKSQNEIEKWKTRGELFLDYEEFKKNTKLRKIALETLNAFGLIFFKNLNKHDNNEFELNRLLDLFGVDTRRTFYGDLWNVTSLGNQAKNVANTNLALDFHMDLVHFENPPRFQFLHCLKNDVIGGSSGFIDSYSVALELARSFPSAFKTLASTLIPFEYINDGHHTFYKHPTIELKPHVSIERILSHPTELIDTLVAINYSPPFQAPLTHPQLASGHQSELKELVELVDSLKKFESLFHDPDRRFRFEIGLDEGQAVGFDNRRILHARTHFNSKPGHNNPEQVQRWLKGAYVDGDSVWDRIRILNS